MGLEQRFAAAGLAVEIADEPLRDVGNHDVFQMDIAAVPRRRGGGEVFRVWPGHRGNRLEVVGLDRPQQQLVLMVHEPSRAFVSKEELPWQWEKLDADRKLELIVTGSDGVAARDVIGVGARHVTVRRRTPEQKRHYLCGMDERHLFVAQLPEGCSTVREAHRVLEPRGLESAAVAARRQGEWFFVEATEDELAAIEEALPLVRRKASVGPGGGRPHIVDEVVQVRAGKRFARGAVRHPDHRTIHLHTWHGVFVNREERARNGWSPDPSRVWGGSLWID